MRSQARARTYHRCRRRRRHERAWLVTGTKHTARDPHIIDWVGSLCDSRLIKMRPSAPTGVHLFHQAPYNPSRPGHDIGDTCRAGCVKPRPRSRRPSFPLAHPSLPLSLAHYLFLFLSVCTLCLSLSLTRRVRARIHSCVTVNHRKSERASPPAHFRKCFQNIAAVLNLKYAGEGCGAVASR